MLAAVAFAGAWVVAAQVAYWVVVVVAVLVFVVVVMKAAFVDLFVVVYWVVVFPAVLQVVAGALAFAAAKVVFSPAAYSVAACLPVCWVE